jgi:hypothetical protein
MFYPYLPPLNPGRNSWRPDLILITKVSRNFGESAKDCGEKWRNIYTKINEVFGKDYTYSRSGILQKIHTEA